MKYLLVALLALSILPLFITFHSISNSAPHSREPVADIGSLVFGGPDNDYCVGLEVINDDYLVLAGHSDSSSFGRGYEVQRYGVGGKNDIVVLLVSRHSLAVEKILRIGGSEDDCLTRLSMDSNGFLYLAGHTLSKDFPAETLMGKPSTELKTNIFLIKIHALLDGPSHSTLMGGSGFDYPGALAIGKDGVYVGGYTASPNFPGLGENFADHLAQSEDEGYSYGFDGFVTKMNFDLTTIMAATFMGGGADEFIHDMALGKDGQVVITGSTCSTDFPTTADTYRSPTRSDGVNAFITVLKNDLSTISTSMVLEPSNHIYVRAIAIDRDQSFWITGYCNYGDFPTSSGVIGPNHEGGGYDGFVVHFDKYLSEIISSSYLGGGNNEFPQTVDITPDGDVLIGGYTDSFGTFPSTNNFNKSRFNFGHFDTFITVVSHDLSVIKRSIMNGGNGYDFIQGMKITDNKKLYAYGNTTSSDIPTITPGRTDNKYKNNDMFLQIMDLP